ncbi:MAG: GNAT family N-acetyltransferase [Acidimicrobiia bacterium]
MSTVRPYEPGDLQACRDLWVELTEHHRLIYGVDSIGGDDPGSQFDDHLAAVGPTRLWVAEHDGAVVGLTGLIVDGTSAEVEPVVVSKAARGRGFGVALVERVVAEARTLGIELLSVRPVARNTSALRFFHDAGFDVLGHIEAFMDLNGERDWVPGETIAGREFRV